ncbi:phosphatase PAP2 family protein [Clostridium tyrobutyricum]|uniref:phosphatase PAP2 family protein n=1 Tax=Clostridium tyrobutyricum TaxID=1519 RepID=UPI001C3818D4|nr:phosphatase PAP2 family protein [Clostridium tyrobutyricum]MBV4423948.1 phosphatase PAP2 family protein [Clostridium tyrobutyricum]
MEKILPNLKKNLIYLSMMITIPILNIAYGLLDNSSRGYYVLATRFDVQVPFIKVFILPYWIWYPFMIISLVYFCINYRCTYYKVLFTIITGMISCYIVYFLFQTMVPRPSVYGSDILSDFIRITYKCDKPFNGFPSIHVLTTYVVMRGAMESIKKDIKAKLCICIVGLLIILATQFVKQHVILDLVAAIILGEIIYRFIAEYISKISFLCIRKFCKWFNIENKLQA